MDLFATPELTTEKPIRPELEMGAYEALWLQTGATFKTIAEKFSKHRSALPSDFIEPDLARESFNQAMANLRENGITRFGIRVHGAGDYPDFLRHAKEPIELLYFQGTWEYVESPAVAIVGTRKPSDDGIARARRIAKILVDNDITVVSGLADGIDTAAHTAALEVGGRTIAVIGTPLGQYYPKRNTELQKHIAANHLLVSQVPILRYARQKIPQNRLFFPERNKTMSALTRATIIVEAGETSGTLIQARAALHQGRKLLLLDSLFNRPDLTWPHRFLEQGAIRIRTAEDILHYVS